MKKHAESHMDHGFTADQWTHIFAKFAGRDAFFIETFELPYHLGEVTNELYGPTAGNAPVLASEVFYTKRGDRAWPSRMVKRPKQPTRFVRVIAGPHEEECPGCSGSGEKFSLSVAVQFGSGGQLDGQFPCNTCKGTKVIKHDCILYTAYGVASLDAPQSPKEPGDIRKQLEEWHDKRAGLHDMSPEYKMINDLIITLREKRTEADAFWSQHALASE